MKKYDVAVIGSGAGGFAAAYILKKGNKDVLLIEEDLWGGTCPNRGCDPKKVLLAGVEGAEHSNQLAGKGLFPVHAIDWPRLMAFKRTFTVPYPAQFKKEAQGYGIDMIKGSARFISGSQIDVSGQIIEADAFVIATGQHPGILNIKGKEFLKTSTDFLDMEEMPPKIAFLGGGYIAFELAAIANAAGSEVTVVHHNTRPLKAFDEALVSEMVRAYQAKGIHFEFGVEIEEVAVRSGRFLLSGGDFAAQADYVVCATGREPSIKRLDLEKAGVTYDKRGILVNEYLQTSNPSIFACGDVLSKKQPKLTPVATFEGKYVAKKILDGSLEGIAYPPVATVTYGSPKLAQVGITADEAGKSPGKYSIKEVDMTDWFNYRRLHEPVAKAKLVYENGRLAGACVLNGRADDLINYLAILIDKGLTHRELGQMILASPTIASDLHFLL